jgi:hypothetical protein
LDLYGAALLALILLTAGMIVLVVMLLLRSRALAGGRRNAKKELHRELSRAQRFGGGVGVVLVEMPDAVPRGVHGLLPGETVGVERLEGQVRHYDMVTRTDLRRYTIILPSLSLDGDVHMVKDRIRLTASEEHWGPVRIGVATYPADGDQPAELLKRAVADID